MRIGIIGAGASGLAAACRIGERAEVVLYEHSDRVGKKILQTGAGRCNVMNSDMTPNRFFGDDKQAVERILSGCEEKIKSFFEELGLVKVSFEPFKYQMIPSGKVSLENSRIRSRLISLKENC